MARRKAGDGANSRKPIPAVSPEARENQLIALAVDLAEKQLLEGTASSQVVTHYLKLGTAKHQAETHKINKEVELLNAKTEALKSAKRVEELYEQALAAMKTYSGHGGDDYYDDDL